MADRTSIEWTDATWTPVKGCTRKSPGCVNCYAEIMAARFSGPGMWGEGLARIVDTPQGKDHRWTGVVRFDERELLKPLSWRRPRKIFVCSTSDLFQDGVTDEQIDRVFAIMALCPQHTFQVLTKRPERMRAYLDDKQLPKRIAQLLFDMNRAGQVSFASMFAALGDRERDNDPEFVPLPLPNVWLGTSVEDQQRADERIPHLLATPASVRFLSCEPLLGAVDLESAAMDETCLNPECWGDCACDSLAGYDPGCRRNGGDGTLTRKVDWVIVGGESGLGARPMHPDWARSLRDQCAAAGVPFMFKQWGEWSWAERYEGVPSTLTAYRAGKKAAGRLLDGVEHSGFPAGGGAA